MGESFMAYHADLLIRDYQDRGMAKWMGFYLSEHTSEMEKEKKDRATLWIRKPRMDEETISEILEKSYTDKVFIELQLGELNAEGYAKADVVGVVEGFSDTSIFVSHPDTGLQIIPNNSINHVQLLNSSKWSDLS